MNTFAPIALTYNPAAKARTSAHARQQLQLCQTQANKSQHPTWCLQVLICLAALLAPAGRFMFSKPKTVSLEYVFKLQPRLLRHGLAFQLLSYPAPSPCLRYHGK